jgi:uncharacterized SAM-binding protein YcdF (DUF218 family)
LNIASSSFVRRGLGHSLGRSGALIIGAGQCDRTVLALDIIACGRTAALSRGGALSVYLVIFGAAVRADGSASGSLRRRCEQAAALGRRTTEPMYLATGGVGRWGAAEALVMRDILLELGVPAARIVVEPQARDTLESVRLCTRILCSRGDAGELIVCSSSYHNPRCVLLFRLAGFRCRAQPVPSDRAHLGWGKWLRYALKEFIVTPWDLLLLQALKMRGTV